jgi:hypothetical protein
MLKLSSTLEHVGKNVAKMQTTNLYGHIFAMLKYITSHFSTIVYHAGQRTFELSIVRQRLYQFFPNAMFNLLHFVCVPNLDPTHTLLSLNIQQISYGLQDIFV